MQHGSWDDIDNTLTLSRAQYGAILGRSEKKDHREHDEVAIRLTVTCLSRLQISLERLIDDRKVQGVEFGVGSTGQGTIQTSSLIGGRITGFSLLLDRGLRLPSVRLP